MQAASDACEHAQEWHRVVSGRPLTLQHSGRPLTLRHSGRPLTLRHSGRPLTLRHSGRPLTLDHSGRPLKLYAQRKTAHTSAQRETAHTSSQRETAHISYIYIYVCRALFATLQFPLGKTPLVTQLWNCIAAGTSPLCHPVSASYPSSRMLLSVRLSCF